MRYFQAFPKTVYNNQLVTNISLRVIIDKLAKLDKSLYHPYTIKDGDRPDIVAVNYYGDSYYLWLIFLVNDITDPYYDWPLDEVTFKNYIIKKYGSLVAAQQKIEGYKSLYTDTPIFLTPDSYNVLPLDEFANWSSYSAYDMEVERNESKRYIKLVDKSYAIRFDNELKALLKNG